MPELNSINDSYAMEFVKWENWLGMKLAQETLENFREPEIIAHCLYEMTFYSFKQNEIQEQYASINNSIEDFKKSLETYDDD